MGNYICCREPVFFYEIWYSWRITHVFENQIISNDIYYPKRSFCRTKFHIRMYMELNAVTNFIVSFLHNKKKIHKQLFLPNGKV